MRDATGEITLAVTLVNGDVTIEIRGTGTGIAPEDLPNIFEPFFTRKSRGTGFSLAISKQIVNLHNGKITVTSVRGSGTTVKISLPKNLD